jgi:hypothetical protein
MIEIKARPVKFDKILNSYQMMMEKHKLIQLILKDLEELNEIAHELRQSDKLSRFELDIALSKSKLVFQEFEFLKELNGQGAEKEASKQEPIPASAPTQAGAQMEEVRDRLEEMEAGSKQEVKETDKPELQEERAQPTFSQKPEMSVTSASKTSENENPPARQKVTIEEQAPEPEKESAEIEEEEEAENIKKTVGENFIKGKSLNDLMLGNKTLDKKLASSPITKLETAIGLNDRFQYTRELFNNQPELFRKTVQEIDQAASLNDAVAYLNSNFRWKKTDTSIQFAQLVKRRFIK